MVTLPKNPIDIAKWRKEAIRIREGGLPPDRQTVALVTLAVERALDEIEALRQALRELTQ